MKLQVFICEDKATNQDTLKEILEEYFRDRHISCSINAYIFGKALIDDFKNEYIFPDIVFMDIHLKNKRNENGIEICKQLRELNFDGIIVFTTSDKTHAIEAYDVDARGYLLKPYDISKIYDTLDRILSNSQMRSYYTISTHHRIVNILRSKILYVESYKTQCIIHCAENIDYTIYKKLSDIETELDDSHFLRCHQSYLINMDYVLQADKSFILTDGSIVPIRKRELGKIKEQYYDFIKES